MPAFYILTGIGVAALFVMISFLYRPIGRYISKLFRDAKENAVGEEKQKIRVLKHGTCTDKYIYKKRKITCYDCRCVFSYKPTKDDVKVDCERDRYFKVTCPECGKEYTQWIF